MSFSSIIEPEISIAQLPSRNTFQMQLSRQWLESSQTGEPLTLLLMDLDNFKRINDAFGHLSGDQLLQEIADVLIKKTRAQDFVARLGGDEFAVILPNMTSLDANPLIKKIHAVMIDFFSDKGQPVTLSIGIAEAPPFETDAHALIEAAEQALYAEKMRKHEDRKKGIFLPNPVEEAGNSEALTKRTQKNARLIALLDTFEEGDAEEQRQDLAALQIGIDAARPGQRSIFGEGFNL